MIQAQTDVLAESYERGLFPTLDILQALHEIMSNVQKKVCVMAGAPPYDWQKETLPVTAILRVERAYPGFMAAIAEARERRLQTESERRLHRGQMEWLGLTELVR